MRWSTFLILYFGFQVGSAVQISDDDALYNRTINDDRTHEETFYTSITAVAIAATSALISALASMAIMFIAVKKKLNTVYHRLMFAVSAADIVLSLSIALTTLPMPKDMIYEQFQGLVLGNTNTCNAQGFAFMFGSWCTAMYNAGLTIYYLCSIRYGMDERIIQRYIEPAIHAVSISFGIIVSFILLTNESFNPTPHDVWCTASVYPWWCSGKLRWR